MKQKALYFLILSAWKIHESILAYKNTAPKLTYLNYTDVFVLFFWMQYKKLALII